MQHTRQGQLGGSGATADLVGHLEDRHLDAGHRQRYRGSETVGSRSDDCRGGHRCPATSVVEVTVTGIDSVSFSHDWRVIMSETATVPSSMRPVAASTIR